MCAYHKQITISIDFVYTNEYEKWGLVSMYDIWF